MLHILLTGNLSKFVYLWYRNGVERLQRNIGVIGDPDTVDLEAKYELLVYSFVTMVILSTECCHYLNFCKSIKSITHFRKIVFLTSEESRL